MNEETKQAQPILPENAEQSGTMHQELKEYQELRDLLRADRNPEQVVIEEDQSLAQISIELFVDANPNLELSGEIEIGEDGRAEATLWVTEPLISFEDLNGLAGNFMTHLGTSLTLMVFGYDETSAVLEAIMVSGDTFQDFKITFAGPHVQHAVALSDAWHDSLATDFQA